MSKWFRTTLDVLISTRFTQGMLIRKILRIVLNLVGTDERKQISLYYYISRKYLKQSMDGICPDIKKRISERFASAPSWVDDSVSHTRQCTCCTQVFPDLQLAWSVGAHCNYVTRLGMHRMESLKANPFTHKNICWHMQNLPLYFLQVIKALSCYLWINNKRSQNW